MNNEKQIQEWLDSGTINPEQAEKMLSDVVQKKKDDRSNKMIVAVSTVGSILLGIGAILFVASNWEEMSNIFKVILLTGSTFGAYCAGFALKYSKKNLPKVGASLLFLGALLFGASVFLIAQMYHVNANAHSLVLIWLIFGVLPLVYAFLSLPSAVLASILFYVWIGLYLFRNDFFDGEIIFIFPIIYLVSGALLFSIGGLHYFKTSFQKIARIYRLVGIKIMMMSLFLLTFEFFSGEYNGYFFDNDWMFSDIPSQLQIGIVMFAVLSILGLAVNLFFNPTKSDTNPVECGVSAGLIAFTMLFTFFPSGSGIYTLFFNLIFAGLTGFLVFMGYRRSDMKLVNTGIFWLSAFLIAKYFDFFYNLLERSLFFIIGGIILILGGIALEKKRRNIKEDLKISNESQQVYE